MLHKVAFLLLAIGGLNWLALALTGWDVSALFGGQDHIVSKIIFILVGASAIYELMMHKKNCMQCQGMPAAPAAPGK